MTGVHTIALNSVQWFFDRPMSFASAVGLKVNGTDPTATFPGGPDSITCTYVTAVLGDPWTIPAACPGITPTPAFPQSGNVTL